MGSSSTRSYVTPERIPHAAIAASAPEAALEKRTILTA